ncbi:hypothetical protein JCGZ_21270 [Jatropha curcas]|uniref:Ubiquitin-like domain-containing protein n=1 Tax=Jatropha curcas TaxID=180498 RepID=A0A067JMR9_JATCU|nr:uncharacterized protein LOC110011064 [Jatropha curcas]KDP20799.1 hypothetical protein JCGZ_21270 [Jatropha curcas]
MIFWVEHHSSKYPIDLPNPSIKDIKVDIAKLLDIDVASQKLTYNGIHLENDKLRAEDYGIKDNDHIFLTARTDYFFEANGGHHYMRVWEDQTVSELKKDVWVLTGIPAERMELSYIGYKLQDDQTVGSYQIPEDAIIDVLEWYDMKVMGYNGIYMLKVHKRMTIGQVKHKLHVEYGLDHTKMRIERAYGKGLFRDNEYLSSHPHQVIVALDGGA